MEKTQYQRMMELPVNEEGLVKLYTCNSGLSLNGKGCSFWAWLEGDAEKGEFSFLIDKEFLEEDSDGSILVVGHTLLRNVEGI